MFLVLRDLLLERLQLLHLALPDGVVLVGVFALGEGVPVLVGGGG